VRMLSALVDINNNSDETNQLRLSLANNSTAVSPHSTSIFNQPADFSNFNLVSEIKCVRSSSVVHRNSLT